MYEAIGVLHQEIAGRLVESRAEGCRNNLVGAFPLTDVLPDKVPAKIIFLYPDSIFIDKTLNAILHMPLAGKRGVPGVKPQSVKRQ
jgi:hypothetical protein